MTPVHQSVAMVTLVVLMALWLPAMSASTHDVHAAPSPDALGAVEYNHSDANSSHGNDSSGHHSSEHHGIHVAAIDFTKVRDPLVFTIVVLLAGLSKIVYHHANFLSSKIPESCILVILGTAFGAVIYFTILYDKLPAFFTPHDFFLFLLPPIILESAYSLHDRTFLDNIGSVLLFAVVGTVIACFAIGLTMYGLILAGAAGTLAITLTQILIFTALIVAVDPVAVLAVFQEVGVNDVLYFLVFGESLLNDGVTVVLYTVMQAYNRMETITAAQLVLGFVKFFVVCFGGLALGVIAGVVSALLTRFTVKVKVVQPLVIYAMAYLGFLLAELFEFSGIISIIACGLTQVQYAFHNISPKSRTTIKYFTKVISSTCEIIIFLFLGLALVGQQHVWHTGFILWTLFLILLYRFLITFLLSFLINRFDHYRVRKIGYDEQFMIAYGGLRGAVCFSLVALLDEGEVPQKKMFVTATLVVIMFTVFVQGISIKPLVKFFRIKLAPEKDPTMYKELTNHVCDHMMAGVEEIIGVTGKNHFRELIDHFDDRYLKKFLQNNPERSDTGLKAFYEKIMLKEHFKYLRLCGAKEVLGEGRLPEVDTKTCLRELVDRTEDEDEEDEEAGGIVIRTPRGASTRDVEPGRESSIFPILKRRRHTGMGSEGSAIDARGLRSMLLSQRSSRMLLHSNYDRNLVVDPERVIVNQLRLKSSKNHKLQRMLSCQPVLQRHASWNDDQAAICELREGETSKLRPIRAQTVDLGDTLGGVSSLPTTPRSKLDSVFEEEEEAKGGEGQPLLDENGRAAAGAAAAGDKASPQDAGSGEEGEGGGPHRKSSSKRGAMARQNAMDAVPMQVLGKKRQDSV